MAFLYLYEIANFIVLYLAFFSSIYLFGMIFSKPSYNAAGRAADTILDAVTTGLSELKLQNICCILNYCNSPIFSLSFLTFGKVMEHSYADIQKQS